MTTTRLTLLVATFAFALLAPLPASAQDASETPAAPAAPLSELDDSAILRELVSADYHQREAMTRRLLQDESVTTDRLQSLFAGIKLPEQRHRLLVVAEHVTLREAADRFIQRMAQPGEPSGPGAIGVNHRAVPAEALPGLEQSAVLVSDTLPGFPAHAFLQAGDLILAVDGEPLDEHATTNHFANLVQARAAGQEIMLQVQRNGQRIEQRFRLAHRAALDHMYQEATPRHPYHQQWQTMHEQLLRQAPGPQVLHVRPTRDAAMR